MMGNPGSALFPETGATPAARGRHRVQVPLGLGLARARMAARLTLRQCADAAQLPMHWLVAAEAGEAVMTPERAAALRRVLVWSGGPLAIDPVPQRVIREWLGLRLRLRRQLLGLSMATLADRTESSVQMIQRYETGQSEIVPDILYRLSRVLDVDVDWFFAGLEVDPR